MVPWLVGCAGLGACSQLEQPRPRKNPSFPVLLTAQDDGAKPLAGVQVLDSQNALGTTDAEGKVSLRLKGEEGTTVSLTVKCPEAYSSPDKPVVVGLRRLAKGSPQPTFDVQCTSLVHNIVVGIRAEKGDGLNVRRLDEVVGTTDDHGVAHVLVQAGTGEQVSLTIETPPGMRPQNPTLTFVAADRDELVLLDQKFTPPPKKKWIKPKAPPKPMPTKI